MSEMWGHGHCGPARLRLWHGDLSLPAGNAPACDWLITKEGSDRRPVFTLRTKTIQLTLAALVGLSGALPAVATEYQASDYLPLAVGNSWTYHHYYRDVVGEREEGYDDQWPAYFAREFSAFTIEVLRTEELDGQTYYVISEMPSNWPPPPPHFIAGKKLRWEGTQLMGHSGSGEQAIFRFDGANRVGYDIPTVEGDNRVTVELSAEPVPMYTFYFHGNGEGGRGIGFLGGVAPHLGAGADRDRGGIAVRLREKYAHGKLLKA